MLYGLKTRNYFLRNQEIAWRGTLRISSTNTCGNWDFLGTEWRFLMEWLWRFGHHWGKPFHFTFFWPN